MDATLRLGHGHALDAVHAALVLEVGPDALGRVGRRAARLHRDLDVLVAAEVGVGRLQDLRLPAAALGVPQVHAQQVAGEQRRLLAALARLDLEDDVAAVVGVARDEHAAQALARLLLGGTQARELRRERVAVVAAQRGELDRGLGVVARLAPRAVGAHDLVELGVAPPERAGAARVGVDGRVGELRLDLGVLGQQRLDGGERLGHGRLLGRYGGAGRRSRPGAAAPGVRSHAGASRGRPVRPAPTTRQRRWSSAPTAPGEVVGLGPPALRCCYLPASFLP